MSTATAVLALSAFVLTIASAVRGDRVPLWIAVLLLSILALTQRFV